MSGLSAETPQIGRRGGKTGTIAWLPGLMALAVLLIASAGLCWLLWERAIRPAGPLGWDEANHAMWSARIAADARSGQLLALAYDSYRQVYWPPAFSWLLGAWLLVVGPSDAHARSIGLLGLVCLGLTLYWGGRVLAPDRRNAAAVGLVAAAAGMTAGSMLIMSPTAMLDVPAAALLAAGLSLHVALLSTPGQPRTRYASLGALIMATFLMKQHYGVLLALTVAASFIVEGQWYRPRPVAEVSARRRGHIATAAVLCALLVAWFGYPQKLVQTFQSLRNLPIGPAPSSLEGILFYPRNLLWLAGSWPLLAVWLTVLAASCRPSALKDGRIRALLIFIGLQMIFAEISVVKISRHIMPLVPAFALVTAVHAGRLWNGSRPAVKGLTTVLAAMVLSAHVSFAVRAIAPYTDSAGVELLATLTAETRRDRPVLIVGSIDLPAPPAAIDWRLLEQGTMTVDAAGSLVNQSERRFAESVLPRIPAALRAPLVELVDRWPGRTGTFSLYAGLPLDPRFQLRANNFRDIVSGVLARRPVERIVVAISPTDSRETGLTSDLAVKHLTELGYQPERGPVRVESVVVHVLRRVPAS